MTYAAEYYTVGFFASIVVVTHDGQWRLTEQPDPGDTLPDEENDPVPERSDASPPLPSDDPVEFRDADLVLVREGLMPLARRALTYCLHLLRGELLPPSGASLADFVGDVVGMGSKEQMVDANANGVVARVANDGSSGDRAVRQLPRETMGANHPFIASAPTENAVAKGLPGTSPFPAALGLSHLRPEAIFDRGRPHALANAWPTRLIAAVAGDFTRRNVPEAPVQRARDASVSNLGLNRGNRYAEFIGSLSWGHNTIIPEAIR